MLGTTPSVECWNQTKLWDKLKQKKTPESNSIKRALEDHIPLIEKVLGERGGEPKDFTLHDNGHSFRVANRMIEIIPSDVVNKLSSYELAFLLLSAYLHDIGMTPSYKKVSSHYQYLLVGDKRLLPGQEIEEFQKWLDDDGRGIEPPLCKEQPTTIDLNLAQEVIMHYCRSRHNEWSAEWIEKNLSKMKLGNYVDWKSDLIKLCQSHHQGYQDLIGDDFNPKYVGFPSTVVHLRYLSCVLRVADILEFDPDRTPEVIFQQREVSPGSWIYWWKDHDISMLIEDKKLTLFARPSEARIHRAIEITANEIDKELQLCTTIALEKHFNKCPGKSKDLPHRWDLFPTLHRNITPKEGHYEYIDGAFRPNTPKLLQILSGLELYGKSMSAIRELLQNAFDAVKEQIAYERLSCPNPSDPNYEKELGKRHSVELRLENSGEDYWLICKDTGIGMTKKIIRDYLLVSGEGQRHDILALERKCRENGFVLGRTGQFGIGVLSYFMVADKVVIKTRRSQLAGDDEGTGWGFITEGVGSFGELKKENISSPGSEVRLHLRKGIFEDSVKWFSKLKEYITKKVDYLECQFQLTSSIPQCSPLHFDLGWTKDLKNFSEDLIKNIKKETCTFYNERVPAEVLSLEKRKEIENIDKYWQTIGKEAQKSLRWIISEGLLPGFLGRYRILFPYFDLPGGISLGFLRIAKNEKETNLGKVGKGHVFFPKASEKWSWKGISIESNINEKKHFSSNITQNAIVQIDFYSKEAGRILVNREYLVQNTKIMDEWVNFISEIEKDILSSFILKQKGSSYELLNCRILKNNVPQNNNFKWVSAIKGNNRYEIWEPIRFPAISSGSFMFGNIPNEKILWKRKDLSIIPCINEPNDDDHYSGISWFWDKILPDRILFFREKWFNLVPIWTSFPPKTIEENDFGMTCSFPPEWKHLVGVYLRNYYGFSKGGPYIWNISHPFIKYLDKKRWEWCQKKFNENIDPLAYPKELFMKKEVATGWLIMCLLKHNIGQDIWNGLKDRNPDFLPSILSVLLGKKLMEFQERERHIYFWNENGYESTLNVLGAKEWKVMSRKEDIEIRTILPEPSYEWRIEYKRKPMYLKNMNKLKKIPRKK